MIMFQFLIGRLKTYEVLEDYIIIEEGFNSL